MPKGDSNEHRGTTTDMFPGKRHTEIYDRVMPATTTADRGAASVFSRESDASKAVS